MKKRFLAMAMAIVMAVSTAAVVSAAQGDSQENTVAPRWGGPPSPNPEDVQDVVVMPPPPPPQQPCCCGSIAVDH